MCQAIIIQELQLSAATDATPAAAGGGGIHGTTIVPTLCRPVPLLMCQNPAELGPEGPYCY
jgi:hypothetical protein